MRKIAVVTGTRSEYGPLKILMNAIDSDDELELLCIITGMHLLPKHGNTYKLVEKDFPTSYKIPMPLHGDSLVDMATYLAEGITNMARFLSEQKPDIIVVAGDRSEALATALSSLFLNIPIAHINGGDISGGMIDDSIRHAITKISHIHLASTKTTAERIKNMGEQAKRIYIVGTLAVESIISEKLKTKTEIFQSLQLNDKQTTLLVIQHPITILPDKGYSQTKELLLALHEIQQQTVLIYPNCDAGSQHIINLINEYKNEKYLHIFKNLEPTDYYSLMNSVDMLIGNSSSGIIEAPSLKIPVINIGNRQAGRDRSVNILDVPANKHNILTAIDFVQTNTSFQKQVQNCINKYGMGNASKKIINILKTIEINQDLLSK